MQADIHTLFQSDFYRILDFRCRCTECTTSKAGVQRYIWDQLCAERKFFVQRVQAYTGFLQWLCADHETWIRADCYACPRCCLTSALFLNLGKIFSPSLLSTISIVAFSTMPTGIPPSSERMHLPSSCTIWYGSWCIPVKAASCRSITWCWK